MTTASINTDVLRDATLKGSSLRFDMHAFGVHCYNTMHCTVTYNGSDLTPSGAAEWPSPAPRSPDFRDHWGHASYIGIRNFPEPAALTWVSLDGVEHQAHVDIGSIFGDENILYRLPDSEIMKDAFNGAPDIFLEINDRTVSVYMRAFIPTNTEQTPGNRHSTFRKDLILAWSHVY